MRDDQRRSSVRSDKSPPTLESYLALLQSYEAKKKYGAVFHPEIKTEVFSPGTTSQQLRRYSLSSIRVLKIVSPRMESVCDGTRNPRNGGRTFENEYSELTRRWRRFDEYFNVTTSHPARAGQPFPRPHRDQEAEGHRKVLRRPNPRSASWRRDSEALLSSCHLYRSHL